MALACHFLVCVLYVFTLNGLCIAGNVESFKIVETEYGPVRGQKFLTIFDEKTYFSFRGIPFVEAPLGDLRFKVCECVHKSIMK